MGAAKMQLRNPCFGVIVAAIMWEIEKYFALFGREIFRKGIVV